MQYVPMCSVILHLQFGVCRTEFIIQCSVESLIVINFVRQKTVKNALCNNSELTVQFYDLLG
jgi:hypothetical protein